MRQREDHVVVPDGQEFVLTGREPLVACVRQTLRTVPIATRVVGDGAMIAAHAAIEMATHLGAMMRASGAGRDMLLVLCKR